MSREYLDRFIQGFMEIDAADSWAAERASDMTTTTAATAAAAAAAATTTAAARIAMTSAANPWTNSFSPTSVVATSREVNSIADAEVENETNINSAAANNNNSEEGHEEVEEISYTPYKPAKLTYGKIHPDPVVENSTLGAVAPPDVTYNLAMPADIIYEGKLSNLQLEAVVYGCQRHMTDLPGANTFHRNGTSQSAKGTMEEPPPIRAGFLLGDGAGMGKGRTLAGFVVENIARGRKKHVWISVSNDLYEDAKRDLRDLGLSEFAENNCFNLGKLPYESLVESSETSGKFSTAKNTKKKGKGRKGKKSAIKKNLSSLDPSIYEEGVMFATYSTLIGVQRTTGMSRLEQLIEWCGEADFDGLIMFDECHKAKNVDLDCDGNAKNVGKYNLCSQTAANVVELQNRLPRARVVYCSATSVSEPKNLGFMSRLGLWGPGTEHPLGFNQFLEGLHRLGTGAMELHAMHLKSYGALVARSLSYESCEFSLIDNIGDEKVRSVYNKSTELWTDLYYHLLDRCADMNRRQDLDRKLERLELRNGDIPDDLLLNRDLNYDSDSEGEDELLDDSLLEQRNLRRKFRNRPSKHLRGLYWGAHQRFFRSLCIASKVDTAIEHAKKALEDGQCCIIGLQSTGEARAKEAAKAAGNNGDEALDLDGFVSASIEDLKRIIAQIFPLPPKPKGVIAPEFLNPLKHEELPSSSSSGDEVSSSGSTGVRPLRRARQLVNYSELNDDDDNEKNPRQLSAKRKSSEKAKLPKKKKKKRSNTSDSSDEDSIEELLGGESESEYDDDDDDDDDNDEDFYDDEEGRSDDDDDSYSQNKSNGLRKIPWNEIPTNLNEATMTFRQRVEYKRKVNYKRAAEKVMKWIDTVDSLSLPPNPLDRLINELGGPDQVAELTGRKSRQVQRYDVNQDKMIVTMERRKGEGRLDQINIEEKNAFQDGEKLVAILSEAASTGISLQADKRVRNQRRRVHITLELPWSADKAIQQLGRTHRSNQSSGPIYKFLISDIGGETRFAAAVARKLAMLGALTQGDRRATGSANSLGLGSFDMDNKYGNQALKTIFEKIRTCSETSNDIDAPNQLYADGLKTIDSHIASALNDEDTHCWQEALVPYQDEAESDDTWARFMCRLLTGPCKKLAESRVAAIRDNRSVAAYLDALENGSETFESIKPKISEEILSAKEAGLTLNVLANIWLFDVGIDVNQATPDVSKFLNRALGMCMKKQSLMTEYFLNALGKEIYGAKSAGKYDVGIKTLTGNNIEFAGKPRSFCFRGLAAKDERVLLYQANVDSGITFDVAMDLYSEAKRNQAEEPRAAGDGWTQRDQSDDIVSGFYQDNRSYLLGGKKVFLYINPGDHSDFCTVVRPNSGRYTQSKRRAREMIISRANILPIGPSQAKQIWDFEFAEADCPVQEYYQFSCIIPILNKVLVAGNFNDMNFPRIVRIETSESPETRTEISNDSSGKTELTDATLSTVDFDVVNGKQQHIGVSGNDDVGKGIARKFLGESVFRGTIKKYKDNDENKDDPSGKFYVEYTHGKKMKMDAFQARHGRRLYESEVARLARVGMPRMDATSLEEYTCASAMSKSRIRRPVVGEEDADDPRLCEELFEDVFEGDIPNSVVGLQFFSSDKIDSLLKSLSKRLIVEGVESSHNLRNLEVIEANALKKTLTKKI